MLIKSFFKSLASLKSKDLFKIILKSILITFLTLLGMLLIIIFSLDNSQFSQNNYLEGTFDILGKAGSIFLVWFAFPLILPLVVSIFVEKVAKIIEKKEYPDLKPIEKRNLNEDIVNDFKFIAKALFLNLIFIPLYLIPLINIFAYYLLNSYLLGKEFFFIASRRYVDYEILQNIYKKNRFKIISMGLIIAFATTFPIINLIAPIFAIVFAMHLFYFIHKKQINN